MDIPFRLSYGKKLFRITNVSFILPRIVETLDGFLLALRWISGNTAIIKSCYRKFDFDGT